MHKVKLSLVIPVCNEEGNIEKVYSKANTVLHSLNLPYEIIFVDDGSRDKTYEILKSIQSKDGHIRVIKLAKNYGQSVALLAGFEFLNGEIIITMDADLENDARDIPKLLKKIDEGFCFVNGWRWERRNSLIRRLFSFVANWLMCKRTNIRLHDYGCALCVTRREIIDLLKDYGKDARFIKPLLVSLAESVAEVKVSHYSRKSGKSKYNLLRIIKFGLDFLFNFTLNPKNKSRLPFLGDSIYGKIEYRYLK